MNNKGELNPGVLLELFQELASSNKIMQVDFTREDGRQTQFIFKDGSLIYIPLESHRGLEIFLIGEGVLTLEQVDELIKYKKESGLPLEQLIVQADILSEEQLKKIWETIAKDFVLELFTIEIGEYQFQEISTYEENNLAVFPLISLGICETEINQLMEYVASLGGFKSIYKIANNSSFLNIENVSEEQRKYFQSAINGKNNITEIINSCFFTVSKTLQILNVLKTKGSICLNNEEKKNLPVEETKSTNADEVIEKEKAQENVVAANVNTDTPLPTTANFSGSLSVLSLVEVIQILNNARRTGTLTLDIKGGPALLNLINGEIVSISFGDLKNKDAFYQLVTLKKGEFYFESNDGAFPKEMEIPTISLLMEAVRLTDEGSKQSTDDILGKSFDEQPMSSRVLKRKESKASFLIKLGIFLSIVIYLLSYYFIYKPSKEKNEAFAKIKIETENLVNSQKFSLAIETWNKFLQNQKLDHPDWEEDAIHEKDLVLSKLKEMLDFFVKETEKSIKRNDFTKSLSFLNKIEGILAELNPTLQQQFVKEKDFALIQRDIVIGQQKELDYNNWKINLDINMDKVRDLIAEFEHEEALKSIKSIEQNLDKVKDKSLYDKIIGMKKIIIDRESIVKTSQALIDDKNSTFPAKVDAYEKIIANAGLKQPRGIMANKQLQVAKDKMVSFESKLKSTLQAHSKDSLAIRVQLIEQLQKEVSSKEESQFLEKEKDKILEINGESMKLQKNFNDLITKKDFKNAFLIGRKIFENFSDSEVASTVKLPYYIEAQADISVKINGASIELPYQGEVGAEQVIKMQAEKKGCKPISIVIDKNIKTYEIELGFKKAELWSIEFKGDLEVFPKICMGGKGIIIANHNDIEMILLDSGNKMWSRQINNPTKPFKKSNGSKVIMGDDEFWKLDSEICVFENYVAIGSKNSDIYVLNAEDGNSLVKYEMSFYSKCAPMIIRSTLLGNKAFVYTGTLDGNLICVAIEDQSVRLQEKLGDSNNAVLGVFPLNEHSFVVILEQSVQCFSLSTSKLKWSKNFGNKIKDIYLVGNKIYARQHDGLMEITENTEAWKLISYPMREVKDIVDDSNGLVVIGENKSYYLDDKNNRFVSTGIQASDKNILFSNGKLFEQNDKYIKCINSVDQKVLWETDRTSTSIKNLRVVGSYLLFIENNRLHAILLEN